MLWSYDLSKRLDSEAIRPYRRIVVHIGLHKTGTSYLQQQFAANRDELARSGIHFPSYLGRDQFGDNHSHAAVVFPKRGSLSEILDLQSTSETLLISAEELAKDYQAIPMMDHLIASSDPATEFQIIAYLRRPDHMLESVYAESVKNKLCGDITKASYQLNYNKILEPYIERVGLGAITVRPYNKSKWRNGRLLDDMLQALGVPELAGSFKVSEASGVNVSLSRAETFLLSRTANPNVKRRLLSDFQSSPISTESDGNKYFMSPQRRWQLVRSHRHFFQSLGEKFGISDVDDFFDLTEPSDMETWRPFEPNWPALTPYSLEP